MDTVTSNDLQTLTALLRTNADSETAVACLTALQSEKSKLSETHRGSAPLKQIKGTYAVRAKINAEHHGDVVGFPELLTGLDSLSSDRVNMYHLRFFSVRFLAFTSSDGRQLAGVLQIPVTDETPAAPQKPALAVVQN